MKTPSSSVFFPPYFRLRVRLWGFSLIHLLFVSSTRTGAVFVRYKKKKIKKKPDTVCLREGNITGLYFSLHYSVLSTCFFYLTLPIFPMAQSAGLPTPR